MSKTAIITAPDARAEVTFSLAGYPVLQGGEDVNGDVMQTDPM